MKYYSAVVNEDEIKAVGIFPPHLILCSYHYFKKKAERLAQLKREGFDIFIDSGAFSADNSGVKISIDEYIDFIRKSDAGVYAGLDVIGNAAETMKNQKYMEAQGLNPIPTFHVGSQLEELYPLLEYPYIALGGLVFSPGLTNYLDKVWSAILKRAPKLRVHGFGLTNVEYMERYPWHSVDSSSFKSCKRFGRQSILYNGLQFKSFSEDEYCAILEKKGYSTKEMTNKERWLLYDFFSLESYKMFSHHLTELNKVKKFDYLLAQQELFS